MLSDASYNERDDLSDELDDGEYGVTISNLIKELLTVKEFRDIWSACHGGSDPPMNFLFHLAGMNCTLDDLMGYAKFDKKGRFDNLIKVLNSHQDCGKRKLDNVDWSLLIQISELIRAEPYTTKEQAKPLWKRLASTARLDTTCISNLDAPANCPQKSLTMAFIEYVNQRYPEETVAWIADGLNSIGRHDLLQKELEIFDRCKNCGCIVIG